MSNTKASTLLIFTKYPTPGTVKTRLSKAIGIAQATSYYRTMAKKIIQKTTESTSYTALISIDPQKKAKQFMQWLGSEIRTTPQPHGNLGTRMQRSFEQQFSQGDESVIIIGTDCPNITTELLESAFTQLQTHDAVIGPAHDGGYYLIGFSKSVFVQHKEDLSAFFKDIPWSTSDVLALTLERFNTHKLKHTALETKHDIDTWEDLQKLDPNAAKKMKPQIGLPVISGIKKSPGRTKVKR